MIGAKAQKEKPMSKFIEAMKLRRSRYGLSKEIGMSEDEVKNLIQGVVAEAPSPFNIQSARLLVLTGAEHDRLWDTTLEILEKVTPKEAFSETKAKVDHAFKAGYGTIIYFEDTKAVNGLKDQFPTYAHNFDAWAGHANGLLQFAIWTAFAEAGIGANLQHYTELIEDEVRKMYNIPEEYKMVAQMPFGKAIDEVQPKEVMPMEERIKYVK